MEAHATACPKCGRERAAAESACARCGLLASRWEGFRSDDDDGEPGPLGSAFAEAGARWDDERVHDRLLALAVQRDEVPELARRYRLRLDAGADPVAERRLERLSGALFAALRSRSEPVVPARTASIVSVVGWTVVGLLAVGVAAYLLGLFGSPRRR